MSDQNEYNLPMLKEFVKLSYYLYRPRALQQTSQRRARFPPMIDPAIIICVMELGEFGIIFEQFS